VRDRVVYWSAVGYETGPFTQI